LRAKYRELSEIETRDLSLNRYGAWAGAFAPGYN
jgi:D-amino-acid dehydrogenase